MSRDTRQQAKFLKGIGLIILSWLGIIPLFLMLVFGIVVFAPYASIVCVVAGAYIFNHGKKIAQPGEVHDR